ncbi:hypothetical protein ABH935_005748 [Catenulispora sp. GAS73]|uniref:hypothetical protein n=1 Tax=Catenulispora sp. GAS73 TaxID=3156269 RepID=UPI003513FB12
MTAEVDLRFWDACEVEASAGLDPVGDLAYRDGFSPANWAYWTGQTMLVDTAAPRFIAWVLANVPRPGVQDSGETDSVTQV